MMILFHLGIQVEKEMFVKRRKIKLNGSFFQTDDFLDLKNIYCNYFVIDLKSSNTLIYKGFIKLLQISRNNIKNNKLKIT